MKRAFEWVLVPLALLAAFAIVEHNVERRLAVVLASFLSGCTLGLYLSLLFNKRRCGG
jgi:hypothetical protein